MRKESLRIQPSWSFLESRLRQTFKVKLTAAIPPFRKNLWPRHCLPLARELVHSVAASLTMPSSTNDIYNVALKQTTIHLVSDESPLADHLNALKN
jgi:hypothetical protein